MASIFIAPIFLNFIGRGESYEEEMIVHKKDKVCTHFNFDSTITEFSNGMLVKTIFKHSYFSNNEIVKFWNMFIEKIEVLHENPNMNLKELIDAD